MITALLDASVLYRATARSILLYLAVAGVFRARWSETIQDEWVRALLRNDPSINANRLARSSGDALVRCVVACGPTTADVPLLERLASIEPLDEMRSRELTGVLRQLGQRREVGGVSEFFDGAKGYFGVAPEL